MGSLQHVSNFQGEQKRVRGIGETGKGERGESSIKKKRQRKKPKLVAINDEPDLKKGDRRFWERGNFDENPIRDPIKRGDRQAKLLLTTRRIGKDQREREKNSVAAEKRG